MLYRIFQIKWYSSTLEWIHAEKARMVNWQGFFLISITWTEGLTYGCRPALLRLMHLRNRHGPKTVSNIWQNLPPLHNVHGMQYEGLAVPLSWHNKKYGKRYSAESLSGSCTFDGASLDIRADLQNMVLNFIKRLRISSSHGKPNAVYQANMAAMVWKLPSRQELISSGFPVYLIYGNDYYKSRRPYSIINVISWI